MRFQEPKSFDGTRSGKKLENFLWGMDQFFKAALVVDKENVSITSMFLMGDEQLWWRTRLERDIKSEGLISPLGRL